MKVHPQEERGSALLLVVFMILLFTMLGIAIIGATLGGAQRSVTREKDVQSLHMAEMSLNEAASVVLQYLDQHQEMSIDELDKTGLTEIDGLLSALQNNETSSKIGNVAKSSVSGKNVNQGVRDKTEFNLTSKEYTIRIEAKAEVDGVIRTLRQDIVLDSYPDFLKYAMGSEGNVYLNGTPYIIGNLYAGKKLWVKNVADYRYNQIEGHENTVYPRVEKGAIFVQPALSGEGLSIQACEATAVALRVCDVMPQYKGIATDKADSADNLQKYFGVDQDHVLLKDQNKFVTVNVKESFYDKVAEAAGIARSALNTSGTPESVVERARSLNASSFLQLDEPPMYGSDATPEEVAQYTEDKNGIVQAINGTLTQSAIYRGQPLIIGGNDYTSLRYSDAAKNEAVQTGAVRKTNWFIVEGDLIIDVSKGGSTQVRGNILVTGNLVIKGNSHNKGTAEMDATIIALGNTTIEDATIKGLDDKELVLLSQGNILINRVASFSTIMHTYPGESTAQDPTILDAFFYTDKEAELYGVGSAFWIKGGFFAKGDITINAVLGSTSASATELIFDKVKNENENADRGFSRFIVEYNDQVFVHQNVGLPRVLRINMTVGPKQFAD